jgi:hypothetical protein
MALVTEFFSASTSEKMEATDVYLPLSESAKADLLTLLGNEGKYVFLTLKDEVNLETVKATVSGDTIILERGLEGTEAVLHPLGTCVVSVSPTIMAAIKDMVCNYQCCEGGCAVEPVAFDSAYLPASYVGKAWEGILRFTGSSPMKLGIANPPAWMTVVQVKNEIQMSGTPTEAGQLSLGAFGVNGDGTNSVTKEVLLTVAE